MEDHELEKLIDVPPEDQMGPALARLNPRQRRFVCALAVFGGDQERAYSYAGYKSVTPGAIQACSSRLANSEDVVAAIQEESLRRINSATLVAVSTLVELASPTHNKDARLRRQAAVDILDRTGFNAKSEHRIVIKDDRTTAELLDQIKMLAGKGHIPLQVIDTTYVDVVPDAGVSVGVEDDPFADMQ